jgi:RNase_H superfamily
LEGVSPSLREVKDPVLIHYGGYEAGFLKRMRERYPTAIESPALLEKLIKESVNILAFIYGQVYFPTYSNSLKEIAGFLGFSWPEQDATGVHSIIWRDEWEKSMESETQQKLRAYNLADCEALELLTKVLWGFSCPLGTCEQKMLCFFQCSDGRITRDGRKALQKVFECFSPFQVVEQGLDRHSRAAKHRSSAKNGPIFYYDFHHMIIPRALVQIPAATSGDSQLVS